MVLTPSWNAPEIPRFGPAAADASYDVVVIGGGLTGLLTTLLLARAGVDVALLEARRIGTGTSGRTTGKVTLLQGTRLSAIRSRHGPDLTRAYVEAGAEGQTWLRDYCLSAQVAHEDRAAYTYAVTEPGLLGVRSEIEAGHEAGQPLTWVDDPGLPFSTLGAATLPDQFQLDPASLLEALARDCVAAGATLHEETRVLGAIVRDDSVDLDLGTVSAHADRVVVTTGMPFLDRSGHFARCRAERSYLVAFASGWEAPGMYLSADDPVRSLRSTADGGTLLVGGNGHVTGREPSPASRLDELVGWARQNLPVEAPTHRWSAQDTSPADLLPSVGPLVPGSNRLLVATGYSKWGLSTAPAAALLLTKRLLDSDLPDWGAAMTPSPSRAVRALPATAVLNVAVAGRMVGGWAGKMTRHTDGGAAPVCSHLGGVLAWNDAEESWDCPLHGSRFGADGAVLEGPAVRDLEL